MTEVKKRGRPPQGGPRKTRSLNLKTNEELRTLIEVAAVEGGRSLTQEIERRLESSFNLSPSQAISPIGPLLRRFSAGVEIAETRTGKSWLEDLQTFWLARSSFNDLIDRLMPDEPNWHVTTASPDSDQMRIIDDWKAEGREIARAVQPRPWRHPGMVADKVAVAPPTIAGVPVTSSGATSALWPQED